MTVAKIKEQALALGPTQRLRLVQDIWDSLVQEPDNIEVPDWHRRLIDQRLAEHQSNPSGVISLAEAKRRIRRHLARRRKK